MRNARREFEEYVRGEEIICANIYIELGNFDPIYLRKGYSGEEYEEFLRKLDVEYDVDDNFRNLNGTIWLINDEWIERTECYGFEEWRKTSKPIIPEECEKEDSAVKSASKR